MTDHKQISVKIQSYISSSSCQEALTCLNLESVIWHSERRTQWEDHGGLTAKKTAVHKHINDSYCRVNKRTWCHQESKFWGNFINLQKRKIYFKKIQSEIWQHFRPSHTHFKATYSRCRKIQSLFFWRSRSRHFDSAASCTLCFSVRASQLPCAKCAY